MRFNTPEEVIAWADKTAVGDYKRHIEHGLDLNPFCTPGARTDWQKGFDNAPLASWESARVREFDTVFQRGRAVARLLAKQPQT